MDAANEISEELGSRAVVARVQRPLAPIRAQETTARSIKLGFRTAGQDLRIPTVPVSLFVRRVACPNRKGAHTLS